MASLYLVLAPEDFEYIAVFRKQDDAEVFLYGEATDKCSWSEVLEPCDYTLSPNVTSQHEVVWVSYYDHLRLARRCPGCGWKPIIATSEAEIYEIREKEECEEYGCYDFRRAVEVTIDSRILQPPADSEEDEEPEGDESEDEEPEGDESEDEEPEGDESEDEEPEGDESEDEESDSDVDRGYETCDSD